MPKTTPEQNKALVLEAFDTLFNKRDYAAAEKFWSPHYIQHSAHIPPGREGVCSSINGGEYLTSASPNIRAPNGPGNRWWKPWPNRVPSGTWSATAIHLWKRVSSSSQVVGHEGGHQRSPESLAECIRGTVDRLDST